MSEHTPGPWIIETRRPDVPGVHLAFDISSKSTVGIAAGQSQEHLGDQGMNESEVLANARLIAAAPDLLAALETARDYVAGELEYRKQALSGYPDKWRTEEQDLAAIDAALAKARSQS